MLRKHSLIYIALFAILSGCTGGSPSESDARQVFEFENNGYWSYQIKSGVVKVLSFKKVDGQSGEAFGVKFYKMDYEAQLEYLKNIPRRNGYDCGSGWTEIARWVNCDGHKAGDKFNVKGKIEFEKTEKGWKGKTETE